MVARNDNLKPFSERSVDEARELGRKGGKASGEVRRKKADLKQAISIVLSSEVPSSKMAKTLKEMGYENTNEMAMVLSMTQKAIKGDVKAASWISNIIQPAKVEHEVEMSVGVDEKRKVAEEYIRGLFNNDTGNSTEENN